MSNHLFVNFDGSYAYIYVWYSEKNKIIYVGETKEEHGVVGRARGHVGSCGVLRINVQKKGYQLEQITDFLLYSFRLPKETRFTMDHSRHTKAVEFLVEDGIANNIVEYKKARYKIVSITNRNELCKETDIKRIADAIVKDFFNEITR